MTKIFVAILALSASSAFAKSVSVTIKNADSKKIGTAKITETKAGVLVAFEVEGLPPGTHAIHFHEKADCKGPDFKSAGGHFNPEGKEHGTDNSKGAHAGDLPNFVVDAKGKANITIESHTVTLGKNSLLKDGGTALVIHAKADDNKSQPAGNAGDRVACGEIK